MIRRVAQLAVVVGTTAALAACNRDKEPAALTQQPNLETTRVDTSAVPRGPAGATKGTGAPAGTRAGGETAARQPAGGQPAGSRTADTRTAGPSGAAAAASSEANAEQAAARRLFTVQVGSFLNAQTAEAVRARLARDGVPVWTSTATVSEGAFTRVRVGVATNPGELRAIADRIRGTYKWPVWMAMVENKGAVPSDLLGTTRSWASQ